MRLFKNTIIAAFGLALMLGTVSAASADPIHHPRRDQVVDRIHTQEHRIDHRMREGKLTFMQAHRMHMAERSFVRHEQYDARLHNGHITRGEQHALNHRLNRMSNRIGG